MKSKTSFFNKVIFKKNFTMYWPLAVCYLIYETIKVPVRLWLGIRQRYLVGDLGCLADSLRLGTDFYAAAVMAIICGMLLFGYLFKAESASMIHALPVTRTELFYTNVLSGLSFMFVPQIFVFLVTTLISLVHGITDVQYIGIWLLSMMGLSFFLFSLVCFCAMFTGQFFALPVYFGIINFLALGVSAGVRGVLCFLGYGVSCQDTPDMIFLKALSPLVCMDDNVYIQPVYKKTAAGDYFVSRLKYEGGKTVFFYLLAAVIFYLFAWYGYKKRKLESAGDLLTFQWIKPVFRWGMGICTGYAVAVFAAAFLNDVFIRIPAVSFLVLVILFAFIGFFIADMLVQKSFRVFTRNRFKEYGLFFVFALAGFLCLSAVAHILEQDIPQEEQVEEAFVEMNYPVRYEGDEIRKVISLQKKFLEKKQLFRKAGSGKDHVTVSFAYCLKNGKKIYRNYDLPAGLKESTAISGEIIENERKTDAFMQNLVGSDYGQITDVLEVNVDGGDENSSYVCRLAGVQAKHVYDALVRDVKAGVLQKYNLHDYVKDPEDEWAEKYPYTGMTMDFWHPGTGWSTSYEMMYGREVYGKSVYGIPYTEDRKTGSAYLYFGKDCTNIIQTLVSEGALADEDELKFKSR